MSGRESQAMARARLHLDGWRREHGGAGVRIPEGVWGEAVEVARGEGLSRTARALRLDHSRLKARVGLVPGVEGTSDRPETTFVEVGIGPLGSSRTVVELAGRDGDRMRIEVTGPSPVDVVGLSRAFWSRQS
jgi:hypothetical protein